MISAKPFRLEPTAELLSSRIRTAESRLRDMLRTRAPERDWGRVDASDLVHAARQHGIAPLLAARLEAMLRSRRLRESLTLD